MLWVPTHTTDAATWSKMQATWLRLATTGSHWKCRFFFFGEVLSKELSKKIVYIGWGVRATCEKRAIKT